MKSLTFSTKAGTLASLRGKLRTASIVPLVCFTVEGWRADRTANLAKIKSALGEGPWIIRSSCQREDGAKKSYAGAFLSLRNVFERELENAINQVIAAYGKATDADEVFIQPMLQGIVSSGVAFTADMDTLAPYYVINYDESGQADAVTRGAQGSFKTFIQVKNVPVSARYPLMARLITALEEIEELFHNDKLDIEFAFTQDGKLYILQVRPMVTDEKEDLSVLNIKDTLLKVHRKVEKLTNHHPNLLGHRTVFGVMPDWNPAEIIGLKPRQLSISLYKELFTDTIWAYQRDNYGYRNLRSHPLLVSFIGIPFIDVRVDFNSFIPKKLNEDIARKLAEFYIDKLIRTPSYHDKVEFEIVHSCFHFDLHDRLNELKDFNFTNDEIKQIEAALLELTNKIIDPDTGLYKDDIKKIEQLKEHYQRIVDSDLAIIDKIYWLIEDCKRYGTLPFAGIARAAFIAMQLLRTMIDADIIKKKDFNSYINSLDTVANKLHKDLSLYRENKISKESFLKLYGHLRPGTYDITSRRYDEDFENYFSDGLKLDEKTETFSFTKEQYALVGNRLKEFGFAVTVEKLFAFIKEAIEGREYSKYIFTLSLSKILQLVEELGAKVNVDREAMSFVDIKTVLNLYAVLDHRYLKDILEQDIAKNKEFYNHAKAIKLPSLIVDADDVYGFYLLPEEPNFITLKKVAAQVIREQELKQMTPEGKIVFIESADPGYDWMFSRHIAGFITKFGGANSHMAVRAGELGIPAVIGAGEILFNNWIRAQVLEIDAANRKVTLLK